jgi:hypothetical protein
MEGESRPGRRAMLQGLLGGVGAGFALPGLAEGHPLAAHRADGERMARASAKAKAQAAPEFFDAHGLATLDSMAEAIVPGAQREGVARFIDSLLAIESQENQRRFLGALGALEGECITRFAHPWSALTDAQRTELLTAVSTAAPSREGRGWRRGGPPTSEPPDQPTLRDHFDDIKDWVVGVYYSTEAGMRELGWTGEMFFQSFPGCTHPDGHR